MAMASILTFCLSLIFVNLIRRYLHQHLIDLPNHRSSHTTPTPRGGGLGFIVASMVVLSFGYLMNPSWATAMPVSLWLTLIPLILISLLDDWKSLRAGARYLVQVVVSVLIVMQLRPFPQPWFDGWGSVGYVLAFVMTVIGITAMINFFNFMDGLDGLVGGVSLVQFAVCAVLLNQPILWVIVAALAGFLVWNWAPAKIFMGDAGSTFLGALLAIVLLQNSANTTTAWTVLAIALPFLDAVYTLIGRALRRENIFQPHRKNLYQRLHQAGWSHGKVALLYIGATIAVGFSITGLGWIGALLSMAGAIVAIWQVESYLGRVNLRRSILASSAVPSFLGVTDIQSSTESGRR